MQQGRKKTLVFITKVPHPLNIKNGDYYPLFPLTIVEENLIALELGDLGWGL
jgi:hypothetical protein